MGHLEHWSHVDNLALLSEKTKDVSSDFRRQGQGDHQPSPELQTLGRAQDLSQDLSWATNTASVSKTGSQRLHFISILKNAQQSCCLLAASTSSIPLATPTSLHIFHTPRTHMSCKIITFVPLLLHHTRTSTVQCNTLLRNITA